LRQEDTDWWNCGIGTELTLASDMHRREFLKRGAGAVALAALAPGAWAQEAAAAPKRALKKGIMWGTVGVKGSVLEKMKAVKEAGFEGAEMNSHMDQEEVLRAQDATGLAIPSVCGVQHWGKPLSDPDPKVRAEGLEALKQTLRDAKRYGASSVLLVPGAVDKKVAYDDAYKRSQEEIRKAIPLAKELGVKIAIENVWNHFLLSPLEAARYVDEFKSPAVGWHFDVGNILNYGWPEQWIRILGPRIQKLHIKEFSRKKRDSEGLWKGFEVKLLEGDDNWPAVMKAVDEVGYRGWAITEQGGGDSAEGLKDLSERLDKILAC
jgi:L-ribulose-5-phosphate 3-epimerase